MDIREDDLTSPETQKLLRIHLQGMHANSPSGHVFALDLSGLKTPDVTVWTAWRQRMVVGVGALEQINVNVGEIKSMRTHPDHLRQGMSAKLLKHIIAVARERHVEQLGLETGSGDAFEPVLALYRRYGFESGPAFGEYEASDYNQFLHLRLKT